MQRRLFGLEKEYALLIGGDSEESKTEILLGFIRELPIDFFSTDSRNRIYEAWLGNGSRLYVDQTHPEYATAECETGYDLVCNERAGDLILNRLISAYLKANPLEKVKLFKSNIAFTKPETGSSPNFESEVTLGSHENYLVSKKTPTHLLEKTLLPFLITRQIFVGVGHIHPLTHQYLISGRPFHMIESGSLRENRGVALNAFFVRTTGEIADIDHNLWRRIQITCSESNMLEFPLWLKFMTAHLCLRLAEEDLGIKDSKCLKYYSPEIFREVSRDIFLAGFLTFKSGRKCKALALQRYYLEQAKKLSPLNSEEKKAIASWEWIIDLLDCDLAQEENLFRLVGVLDWTTKWWFLTKMMEKNNIPIGSPKIRAMNASYHLISGVPEESLWLAIEQKNQTSPFIKKIVKHEDIEEAFNKAPRSRAKFRSEFIKSFKEIKQEGPKIEIMRLNWGGAWVSVDLKDNFNVNFGTANPFLSRSKSLEGFRQRYGHGT